MDCFCLSDWLLESTDYLTDCLSLLIFYWLQESTDYHTWLIAWVYRLSHWLLKSNDFLIDCSKLLNVWLIKWFTDWFIDWLINWFTAGTRVCLAWRTAGRSSSVRRSRSLPWWPAPSPRPRTRTPSFTSCGHTGTRHYIIFIFQSWRNIWWVFTWGGGLNYSRNIFLRSPVLRWGDHNDLLPLLSPRSLV